MDLFLRGCDEVPAKGRFKERLKTLRQDAPHQWDLPHIEVRNMQIDAREAAEQAAQLARRIEVNVGLDRDAVGAVLDCCEQAVIAKPPQLAADESFGHQQGRIVKGAVAPVDAHQQAPARLEHPPGFAKAGFYVARVVQDAVRISDVEMSIWIWNMRGIGELERCIAAMQGEIAPCEA